MIYIDDNTKDKIKNIDFNSIYFLINFDNVITDSSSSDTWKVITDNIKLKKKHIKKIQDLDFKCRSVELNEGIGFNDKCECISNIWKENLSLIEELNVDEKKIKRFISSKNNIRIRDGVKEFLKFTHQNNIPVIIISDGVAEVINCLLKYNNCEYTNVRVISNSICRNKLTESDRVIHILNRNESSICEDIQCTIKDRQICVLLASSINDINMLSKSKLKESIKIAFLDNSINENFDIFLNYFNIICTHNTSLDKITEKLKVI